MKNRTLKTKYIFLLALLLSISCDNIDKQANLSVRHSFSILENIDRIRVNINNNNFIDNITLFTSFYSSPNEDKSFVSLSDLYLLDNDQGSRAMPNPETLSLENRARFVLTENYRNIFLDKTKISETDSVYVYYYASNILKSFEVKELDVVAILTPYAQPEDKNLQEYDYMFGFEYPKRLKEKDWEDMIIYVGQENPFLQKQLVAINWKEIAYGDFPKSIMMQQDNRDSKKIYLYEADGLKYYIIDSGSYETRISRYLVIVDSKTNKSLLNMQFGNSEGSLPTPINDIKNGDINQWAGKLLKDYPSVIFGLEYQSFGCPLIIVTENPVKSIYLNCDNRH